jgi:hypothetical protein
VLITSWPPLAQPHDVFRRFLSRRETSVALVDRGDGSLENVRAIHQQALQRFCDLAAPL